MKFRKFLLLLAVLFVTFNQYCLAFKVGDFPGKGSIQAWHQAAEVFHDGRVLQDNAKYNEAIAKFQTAIKIYPYEAGYWNNMGNCYQEQKQYKLAESAHRRATVLNPDDWMVWNGLARTFNFEDKMPECKAAFIKALSCQPPSKDETNIQASVSIIDKDLSSQKSSASKAK